MFPVVTVTGTPYERGRQYGEQARGRIHRSVAGYAAAFRYYASWDWSRACAEAQRFLPAISEFGPQYADELAGIAAGAELSLADLLAVNVRTEIMSSARVRTALAGQLAPAECSAFASTSGDGHVLVGQNWDWLPFARDTVVVLEATPDDGPAFTTVVEAGLLAKFGVNSDGVAVMTNALACTEDQGDPGVPYHVMLRALLDCRTTGEALALLGESTRASSANYLVADKHGWVVDVEARPGGGSTLHRLDPDERGVLLHANHFVSPDFDSTDYTDLSPSTSQFRLGRVDAMVSAADEPVGEAVFAAALSDHAQQPDSVCRHPDPALPPEEQTMTVASALVDLSERRFRLSEGPPCERGYEDLDSAAMMANG